MHYTISAVTQTSKVSISAHTKITHNYCVTAADVFADKCYYLVQVSHECDKSAVDNATVECIEFDGVNEQYSVQSLYIVNIGHVSCDRYDTVFIRPRRLRVNDYPSARSAQDHGCWLDSDT